MEESEVRRLVRVSERFLLQLCTWLPRKTNEHAKRRERCGPMRNEPATTERRSSKASFMWGGATSILVCRFVKQPNGLPFLR